MKDQLKYFKQKDKKIIQGKQEHGERLIST
jgi:hypothetical protein